MQHLGRHLVLLTLSGVLLVNLGRAANGELAKQDSLPALVLDEAEQAATSSASPPQATSPNKTVSSPSSVPVSESTSAATAQVDKDSPKKPDQEAQSQPSPDASSERPKDQPQSSAPEADLGAGDKRKSATEEEDTGVSGEKDIRVLLANKNDAENDLASPPAGADGYFSPSGPTLDGARSEDKKKTTKLDSPVDISGASGESGASADANDNRFHYSFGGSPDKSFSVAVAEPAITTKQPAIAEEPKEQTGEAGETPSSEKPAEPEKAPEPEKPAPKETSELTKELASDPLTGKKVEIDDKTKAIVVESVPVAESKPDERLAPVDNKDDKDKVDTSTTTTTTPTPTTTTTITTTSTTEAPSSSTAISTESSSAPSTEQAKSESTEANLTPKDKPATSSEPEKSVPEKSEAKNSTVVAVEPKKPAESATDKSAGVVPSILATALGTALGSAVNPLLKTHKEKDKPLEAASPAVVTPSATARNATTTKAPTSVSTTRKSATDKWDRWSPSTPSSSVPPTRRRPILPSIRRRFRPYNRFSPFPWSTGVDSYSNDDADFAGSDPFNPRASPPVSTTNKPSSSRRRTSSSTPPKTTEEPETDSEATLRPQESGGRRRGQGANKRRHNRPHRYPHSDGESEVGGRRNHHHHHHGHRHFEREDRNPFGGASPADGPLPAFSDSHHHHHHNHRRPGLTPLTPGFGLFNTGATGTGFDLLSPFSGWLDDALKPRPPVRAPIGPTAPASIGTPGRRPGVNPIAVGGDYNDEQPFEHGPEHHHHHQNRPHNGREDYYGDHHHHHRDCDDYHGHDHEHEHDHEHDHDHHHDHNREPYRPQRRPQREPLRPITGVGGDYDTYPASASFGRRPSRPYNRRDQAESERNEQAGSTGASGTSSEQAAPSLYGARGASATSDSGVAPVVARRVPSMFSPFDTLFGSLDDGLFGLRSSFIDAAPAKPAQDVSAFDTVLSSPKISVPSKETATALDKNIKPAESSQKPGGLAEAPEASENNDFLRKTRAFG